MTDVGIVVLKLSDYPLHSGTIGIVRSAGRAGLAVHVAGESAGSPVGRSRYLTGTLVPPGSVRSDEDLARWLVQAAPRGRPVLVPVDDRGAVFVQTHADVLTRGYRYHVLPVGLSRDLADKAALTELARAAGVPSPVHSAPSTAAELEDVLGEVRLPVVVKMSDPGAVGRNVDVPGVSIAHTANEVRSLWSRHLVDGLPNCIVQEFLPGGSENVCMVNAYADADSRLRFGATARKLRQWPPHTGATALGRCEQDDRVWELTQQLVEHIGYRGVMDIDWRFDVRDGQYKLLDFNPRLGAAFRLFTGEDGTDVVRALHADLVHGHVRPDSVPEGRTWSHDAYDWASALRSLRDGSTTLPAYWRSRRSIDERAWAAPDDPAPARAMRRQVLRRLSGSARAPGALASRATRSRSLEEEL